MISARRDNDVDRHAGNAAFGCRDHCVEFGNAGEVHRRLLLTRGGVEHHTRFSGGAEHHLVVDPMTDAIHVLLL